MKTVPLFVAQPSRERTTTVFSFEVLKGGLSQSGAVGQPLAESRASLCLAMMSKLHVTTDAQV